MKMKNKIYSLLVVLLMAPLMMRASSTKTLFDLANDYYNKGEYEQTIKLCDSLLKNNVESAAIYYNMGNAYFKLDNIPKAIYYYEKAKKLEPNNEDINYNIAYANTKIADKIKPVPEFFVKSWWHRIVYSLSEKQWMRINVGFFFLFLIAVVFYYTAKRSENKKRAFIIGLSMLVLSFITGSVGYQSYVNRTTHNTAIVFTPTVNVKSAPDEGSSTLFILHQGAKVKLMEETKNWQKIKIADGSEGWLPKDDFEKI